MFGFLNHATSLPPGVPGAIDHVGGFLPSKGTRPFYYFRTRPNNERCDQLAAAEIAKVRRSHTPEQLAALRETFIASRDPNRNQGNLF